MFFNVDKDVFRLAFKISYVSRGRYRVSRRSTSEVVKLGLLAKELIDLYLCIARWSGFDRVLKVELGVGDG